MTLLLALLACVNDPREGTAVGNPTGLTVDTAPSDAVKLLSGRATVAAIEVDTCGPVASIPVLRSVDLLGGDPLRFTVPSMCALTVRFTGPLSYEVVTDAGRVALRLAVPRLSLRAQGGAMPVGRPLVLQLGDEGWLVPADIGPDGPDAATAARLSQALQAGAAVYVDTDADGRLDADERSAGPVAVAVADGASPASASAVHVASRLAERVAGADASDTGGTDTGGTDTGGADIGADADTGEDAVDAGAEGGDTAADEVDDTGVGAGDTGAEARDADTDDADTDEVDDTDADDGDDTGADADDTDEVDDTGADADDTDDGDDTGTDAEDGAAGARRAEQVCDDDSSENGRDAKDNNGRGANLTPGVPRGPRAR